MHTIHLTGNEPLVGTIAQSTFPEYRGRQFQLHITDQPVNCASCWDGGSRSYFRFLNLATMHASAEVPAQSAFDRPINGIDAVPMRPGFAIVEHSIFCGKDHGLRIYLHPENAAPLLPQQVEVTPDERVALDMRGLKSSYNGISDYRRHEANHRGLTSERYDAAVASCQAKGWLDKRGALTVAGKNVRRA